ncbi:response regulator [Mycetocola spongiae]|uniref:response regulator n=1 Tax=Mycetocola spongiae TaxID=2859226 RepID=UPI001CF487AD|nr:response regulator transcription factor [Mycetocola spongiae]UCR90348.1 response regulator transcription factor [Mycetocola spongiae]
MSGSELRVLIADDQAAVRDGLELILSLAPGVSVVGTAGDGAEAILRARELRPDIVLLDLRMPGTDGVAATAAIRAEHPAMGILVLTTYADDASILGALEAGASGYLTKSAGREQILAALRATAAGQSTFSPEVAGLLRRGMRARGERERLASEHGLTERETRVLELLAEGRSNRVIAEELFISVSTVKTHVNNLYAKLGVGSRAEATELLARYR